MEKELNHKYYFENHPYLGVFKKTSFVWEALSKLPSYLKEKLKEVNIEKGKGTIISEKALINGPVIMGENCNINAFAVVKGPTILGNNVMVGSGATIWGNALIGNNCIIRSEVNRSIVGNNLWAAHWSFIGDSIVGNDVNLGAHSVLANFKNDASNVKVLFNKEKIDTNIKKLGAVLGDGVKLGCHVITDPGTLIGKNTLVYPSAVLRGFYPSNKILKTRSSIEAVDRK